MEDLCLLCHNRTLSQFFWWWSLFFCGDPFWKYSSITFSTERRADLLFSLQVHPKRVYCCDTSELGRKKREIWIPEAVWLFSVYPVCTIAPRLVLFSQAQNELVHAKPNEHCVYFYILMIYVCHFLIVNKMDTFCVIYLLCQSIMSVFAEL